MKIGDLVTLLSGSPLMTIRKVRTAPLGTQQICCTWFANGKLARDVFEAGELQMAEFNKADETPNVAGVGR
jgi:uncharacterized protein YodC (DUF2158 family)